MNDKKDGRSVVVVVVASVFSGVNNDDDDDDFAWISSAITEGEVDEGVEGGGRDVAVAALR